MEKNISNNSKVSKNPFSLFRNKIKYHFDFLRHSRSYANHLITNEDKRLREVILDNYFKSFTIGNLFAFYINYLRGNKTYSKTLLSNKVIHY